MDIQSAYLESIKIRFSYYRDLGEKAIAQLNDAQLIFHADESNSIVMIIRHISGNLISRFTDFLESDGEKLWRNRDEEFREVKLSREELMEVWRNGWSCLFHALDLLNGDDLMKMVLIRGESLSVVDALNRQLAHHAYHIGQIVFASKEMVGSGWQNLSVPKGGSQAFNDQMEKQKR